MRRSNSYLILEKLIQSIPPESTRFFPVSALAQRLGQTTPSVRQENDIRGGLQSYAAAVRLRWTPTNSNRFWPRFRSDFEATNRKTRNLPAWISDCPEMFLHSAECKSTMDSARPPRVYAQILAATNGEKGRNLPAWISDRPEMFLHSVESGTTRRFQSVTLVLTMLYMQ
jgi:hypothetical protein